MTMIDIKKLLRELNQDGLEQLSLTVLAELDARLHKQLTEQEQMLCELEDRAKRCKHVNQ